MRDRLGLLLGQKEASRPFMGTFHALALSILRRWPSQVQAVTGLRPGFTILDKGAAESLMQRLLEAHVRDVGPSVAKQSKSGLADARRVLHAISRMKNSVADWMDRGGEDSMLLEVMRRGGTELTQAHKARAKQEGAWADMYRARLLESNAADFDDLIASVLQLLRMDPIVLAHIRSSSHHLLVDEFQDTNAVQYQIVKLLAYSMEVHLSVIWILQAPLIDSDEHLYCIVFLAGFKEVAFLGG